MSGRRGVLDIMLSSSLFFKLVILVFMILGDHVFITTAQWKEQSLGKLGPFLKKNERSTILSTEYGDISEARLTDGNEAFQLHFITLEPNSLFLPVFLHYDMVFYVQTGSGTLSYLDEDEKEHRKLRRGDVHRLRCGSVFFIQSDLDYERQKLRVIAIFDNPEYDFNEPASGPYSSVSDLVLGFDESVLRAIFKAPEPLIEEIRHGTRPVAIIHGLQQQKKKKNTMQQETEYEFMEDMYNILDWSNKNKKSKLFNVYDKDPDFKNDNGWSTLVDKKKYGPLKGSKYGIFMVYLTEGSMMGPHWNPVATEVAVAVKGRGMIHVVCPRMKDVSKCNDSRYLVEEGDVFVVPRFHAMAQMAFDNETLVFVGFSTSTKKNHPQYLAGKASVPRTLDKHIMAASLGINVTTFEELWDKQAKSIILDCTSCAEEEWMRMMEDIEKERQREEEETRKREEEKRREEEAARKKEEEEAKKREEEAERKREEAAAQKKREVEEAWRRWAEEVRKWQEQQQREQEAREREEQRRREEEEEIKRREQQQEEERERQEQQQKQEEEERERQEQQQKQEEEERERQEQQKKQEEEERERQEQQQKQEEEERERQEQQEREQQQQEEEARERQEQQQKREEEERQRQEQEEREQQQQEDERRERQEQEEWAARLREQERAQEGEREREEQAKKEEDAAKEQEEEAAEGKGQWAEGQEEQEEWTDKEREQAQPRSKEEAATQGQGQVQWRENQGEPVSQETKGQETEPRWWEETHGSRSRKQQASATPQVEEAGTHKWARRILNNI